LRTSKNVFSTKFQQFIKSYGFADAKEFGGDGPGATAFCTFSFADDGVGEICCSFAVIGYNSIKCSPLTITKNMPIEVVFLLLIDNM
jgi:hypothetical protein